jgi:hypothetical protein
MLILLYTERNGSDFIKRCIVNYISHSLLIIYVMFRNYLLCVTEVWLTGVSAAAAVGGGLDHGHQLSPGAGHVRQIPSSCLCTVCHYAPPPCPAGWG